MSYPHFTGPHFAIAYVTGFKPTALKALKNHNRSKFQLQYTFQFYCRLNQIIYFLNSTIMITISDPFQNSFKFCIKRYAIVNYWQVFFWCRGFTYNYYKYQNEMGKFINIHSVPKLIVHIMSNNSRQLQKKEVINSGAKYF